MLIRRHLKKTLVIALGALLAFQAVGWYLAWGVLVVDAKRSAEQTFSLPQTTRQRLTIAAVDLYDLWVDEREIRFEGRLYDVLHQRAQGDSVWLEVYHDQWEEGLFHSLHNLLSKERSTTTPFRSWLLKWVGGLYLLPCLPDLPRRPQISTTTTFRYCLLVAQCSPAQLRPPPKG